MTQRNLFGGGIPAHCQSQIAKPLARANDPSTSKEAAAHIAPSLNTAQAAFIESLRSLKQPSTAQEIAEHACNCHDHKMQESYRKRAGELIKAGRISVAGKRPCRVTNRPAQIYELA
jgi:hypothetical protein